jgi:CMP-N,N'-diacetyllegionaminic acid synthase
MIRGKRVLAVVPARGGSKGIPLKNLRPIDGVPLVARVAPLVAAVPVIDRAVVSTDHEEIARVAEESGIPAPFRRPPELSGDFIGDFEVLSHALQAVEEIDGHTYDIVLMLQPTSPLRMPETVTRCLQMLTDGDWDAVWTVSETDLKYHPLKQLLVGENGSLDYFDPAGVGIIARQQLQPVYHRNGMAYAITRECLLEQEAIKGVRTGALVVHGKGVSIDTEQDLRDAELLLQSRRV